MRAALAFLLALLAVHEILSRALDRVDLVERLLAPGPDALVALPFALLLYAVRLVLVFVALALPRTLASWARAIRRGSS